MIKEANEHEEEDKKRKEEIEIKNDADSLIYTAEKTLADLQDKLNKEQKEKIEAALKSSKSSLESDDFEKIKKETDNLQKVLQEAGSLIYADAMKSSGDGVNSEKQNDKKNEAVDAEFKVNEK